MMAEVHRGGESEIIIIRRPDGRERVGRASRTSALLVVLSAVKATAGPPEPLEEYRLAKQRAPSLAEHLAEALASANLYDRLFAIEDIGRHPGHLTVAAAPALAALAFDRTHIESIMCMSCRTECQNCSGCWGLYGHSDCDADREIGAYARSAIAASTPGPAQVALADALWPFAMRSDSDGSDFASLVPTLHDALRDRIMSALDTPKAGDALKLLVSFPQGTCRAEMRARLERLMTDAELRVRTRAATATLVCAGEESEWRSTEGRATALLTAALADPTVPLLGDLPAVASVVRPLARLIGARMANRTAADGRQGTRLLRSFPRDAGVALAGIEVRLRLADQSEAGELLDIATVLGTKARTLAPSVMICVRRHPDVIVRAIDALAAMKARISPADRRILQRAYARDCRLHTDCQPFNRLLPP